MSRLLFFLLIFATSNALAQSEFVNKEGHYTLTLQQGWRAKVIANETSVYAPPDGEMDQWDEKLDFSISDGDGIELTDAFDFYIKTDFPAAYGKFKLVNQGTEKINGLEAKWATFTFSAEGAAAGATSSGDSTLSATLQALFYVIKKDKSLYLVNGVSEKNLFPKFDSPFRSIIRTFRVKE